MRIHPGPWRLFVTTALVVSTIAAMITWPAVSTGAPRRGASRSDATGRSPAPVRAVRFDPGYYYGTGLPVDTLVQRLVTNWEAQGVNTVYYYAYSFAYGARYQTRYAFTEQEDFGRLNLLRRMIEAAHRRNIKVVAWLYVLRHKGAWNARPDWRSLGADGRPYTDGFDQYFLSPHNPEAVQWWLGFVEDLLRRYPDLDGVDFAEPVVNWWGNLADHSPAARAAFRQASPQAAIGGELWQRFRAEALSRVVEASTQVARRYSKAVHVTMTIPARPDGSLMPPAVLARYTGFDLDRILRGPARPDYVNVELIFQQWVAAYGRDEVFTPEWTATAAAAARALVAGRAGLIVHLELSEFGSIVPSIPQLARALRAVRGAGIDAIDLYATHLLDAVGAWDVVRQAFAPRVASAP